MSAVRKLSSVLVVVALLLAFAPAVAAQDVTPSITVSDQDVSDGIVTVDEVVSAGPGWVVVHADADGSPGPVIGETSVPDGTSEDVEVEVDMDAATETLHVMLHEDTGTEGTWEFPDADPPAQADGETVVTAITADLGEAAAEEETEAEAETEEAAEEEAAETEEEAEEVLPASGEELALPWGWLALMAAGAVLMVMGLRFSKVNVRDR